MNSTKISRELPESIGPFRIVRCLGEGGIGVVYLGERMEQFSQQVAIKILHPHLFPPDAITAVEREGQILAALDHPGIVRMLDFSANEAGRRYLVMEYVDGIPIDRFCDEQQLNITRRIELLLDVLDAVEFAHRQLVVHADLKPENILVMGNGKPRLLDFGAAAVLSEVPVISKNDPRGIHTTRTTDSPGGYTALYASPEQLSGERLTLGSDIFSLGLIIQLVLTGVGPKRLSLNVANSETSGLSAAISAKGLRNLDAHQLESIAELRSSKSGSLVSAIQGDIEAILGKALQLDPNERFQSVQEISNDLRRHLRGFPIFARRSGWIMRFRKWVHRSPLLATLSVVFVTVVIFSTMGVISQTTRAARQRRVAQSRLRDLVRLTDVLEGELYESVHGLPASESAEEALLSNAHSTIDKLASEESQDPALALELARGYRKLARLELNQAVPTRQKVSQAIVDLTRGIELLRRVPVNSAIGPAAGQLMSELLKTRDFAHSLKAF